MRERPVHGVEEHQIADLQLVVADRPRQRRDLRRIVRQPDAGGVLVDVGHHAAAVEAGLRVAAAELVVDVEQA
ncbi:hypothetical protein D3C72_2513560 [compost metagenome]